MIVKHTTGGKGWSDHFMPPEEGMRHRIRCYNRTICYLPEGTQAEAEETDANARLITAAPNLLSVLGRITRAAANRENTMGDAMTLIELQAELRESVTEARAAIAKATTKHTPRLTE